MINQEVIELGVFSPEKQEGREDGYLKGAQRVPSWIKEAFQKHFFHGRKGKNKRTQRTF